MVSGICFIFGGRDDTETINEQSQHHKEMSEKNHGPRAYGVWKVSRGPLLSAGPAQVLSLTGNKHFCAALGVAGRWPIEVDLINWGWLEY